MLRTSLEIENRALLACWRSSGGQVSRFARDSWSQYKNIVVGEDLDRRLTDLIERLDGLRSGLRSANLIKGVGRIRSRLWSSHLIKRIFWVVSGSWDIAIGYVVVFYHTTRIRFRFVEFVYNPK
jgi:hypothetical protein